MREEGIEKEGEPLHVMIDVDSFTKCQYLFFVLLQKEHSTRVYKQALEVYRGQGWTLAEVCYMPCCTSPEVHTACSCPAHGWVPAATAA